jgi:hypothetical protein
VLEQVIFLHLDSEEPVRKCPTHRRSLREHINECLDDFATPKSRSVTHLLASELPVNQGAKGRLASGFRRTL